MRQNIAHEGGSMRVLLVDDDGDSRIIFRTIFQLSGYEVIEAADGLEALRAAGEHSLDVILMDMELPGKHGCDTTRALKENAGTSHIPVIGISAHAMPQHRARALAAGCIEYLTKPIEPASVVEEVERILRTGSG